MQVSQTRRRPPQNQDRTPGGDGRLPRRISAISSGRIGRPGRRRPAAGRRSGAAGRAKPSARSAPLPADLCAELCDERETPTRRAKAKIQAEDERLDATPERLAARRRERPSRRARRRPAAPAARSLRRHALDARARAARSAAQRRALADRRSLRRLHQRAQLDALRAVALEPSARSGFGPRSGLPASEVALHARDKLREAEERAGAAAWPIVARIVIEGGGVRDCRVLLPEIATPWRADAIIADRLRVALDRARRSRRRDGGAAARRPGKMRPPDRSRRDGTRRG